MPVQNLVSSGAVIRVVVVDQLVSEDVVQVREALESAPRGVRVEFDLREARSCQAHALLAFAQQVADRGAKASFLGLTESDRRLLQYLGHEVLGRPGHRPA